MFSDKDNKNLEKIETRIGEQCNIIGTLTGGGTLKIEGMVEGDTNWNDDLIIGTLSIYNGNISCRNGNIAGKVTGNIICSEILTIESSAKIIGDITTKKLVVKEGATVDGKCTMIELKNPIDEAN